MHLETHENWLFFIIIIIIKWISYLMAAVWMIVTEAMLTVNAIMMIIMPTSPEVCCWRDERINNLYVPWGCDGWGMNLANRWWYAISAVICVLSCIPNSVTYVLVDLSCPRQREKKQCLPQDRLMCNVYKNHLVFYSSEPNTGID